MHPAPKVEVIASLVHRVILYDDHLAFEQLVHLNQSPVRLFLRRLTGQDQAHADDLAQETFFKAYRHISSFRGEGRFLSWLFKIAYQEFLRDRRRNKGIVFINQESTTALPCPHSPKFESKLTLNQVLTNLDTLERATILLSVRYGLTHQELATALDLPLGTVKTHIRRGKEKLRQAHKKTKKRR